jgi:amidohydrolase
MYSYRVLFVGILAFSCFVSLPADEPKSPSFKDRLKAVEKKIDEEFTDLEKLYKDLHQHPELSLKEERSAAKLAKELESLGFEVTTKIGGTGIVGLLKNGKGPTILVRTDLDALPVIEQTGLPYASKVTTRDKNGREVGVMHACGHDMHMTCWVGTARVLASMKDRWSGTLMFIGQPAEEIGAGARMMLADGLFKKFPKPDYCLALHCDSALEVGYIHYNEGLAMANVDSVDILVKGKGGHGAAPNTTIDPIVIAAKLILDLQTIVSREMSPNEPAVVTVGSIHGGTKHNIIPNEVKLQITVRTTKDSTRKEVLDTIKRKAKAAAASANAPEPEFTVYPEEFTPALTNDRELAQKTVAVFRDILGADKLLPRPTMMGGEDFSRYAIGGEIPIFMYFLGTVSPDRVAESKREGGKPLPSMHSDSYFPAPEMSIRTGVKTMSMAVLNLNGK